MKAFLYAHVWHSYTMGVVLLLGVAYSAIAAAEDGPRYSKKTAVWALIAGVFARTFIEWIRQ